jgi:hypothetical protein
MLGSAADSFSSLVAMLNIASGDNVQGSLSFMCLSLTVQHFALATFYGSFAALYLDM